MRSKPTLLIILITVIIFIGVLAFWFKMAKEDSKMANPFSGIVKNTGSTQTPSPFPTPTPSPTPRTFNFDSSTDLKGELDTINPQVLDSDFDI